MLLYRFCCSTCINLVLFYNLFSLYIYIYIFFGGFISYVYVHQSSENTGKSFNFLRRFQFLLIQISFTLILTYPSHYVFKLFFFSIFFQLYPFFFFSVVFCFTILLFTLLMGNRFRDNKYGTIIIIHKMENYCQKENYTFLVIMRVMLLKWHTLFRTKH